MKKVLVLILALLGMGSCIVYVFDFNDSLYGYGGRNHRSWWNDCMTHRNEWHFDDDDNPQIAIRTVTNSGNADPPSTTDNPQADDGQEEEPVTIPPEGWDSCRVNTILTFNFYVGWPHVSRNICVRLSRYSTKIHVNVYTNGHSMSMYGFHYREDPFFYSFTDDDEYCGVNSYSIDTRNVCRYEIVISENDTGQIRTCSGYWACNNDGLYDGSYGLVIDQYP